MKQRISIIALSLILLLHLTAFAQPTFEVRPVPNDTTFQIKTTVTNTDDSETVTVTPPYDSTAVRGFIITQLNRNSRVTAKEVKKLSDLNAESRRLKALYNDWNDNTYFQYARQTFTPLYVGKWRLRYDGAGTLMTVKQNRQVEEIDGDKEGIFVADAKDIFILRDYMDAGTDIIFYKEKGNFFVGEYLGKKIILRKISD